MMSEQCQKVLSRDINFNVASCDECLKFRAGEETTEHDWSDPLSDVKQEDVDGDSEGFQDEPNDRLSVLPSLGRKVKIYQCDRIGPCQYQTTRSHHLKMHIKVCMIRSEIKSVMNVALHSIIHLT